MDRASLIRIIKQNASYLSVGLDTDLEKIPSHLLAEEDPIFAFNKAIIDATKDLCIAYKPNTAFYECYGAAGWSALKKTIDYIGTEHFIIADAKRGDIGNTSSRYAKAFFESMAADSITVAPYMGEDSVKPFLQFDDKWVILLALTSNKGSADFQRIQNAEGINLYEQVITTSSSWGTESNLMYVVGATHPDDLRQIRKLVPKHFLLIPGVGAQGGSLEEVSEAALMEDIGIIVNSSRGIIYASSGTDFAEAARAKAQALQSKMKEILRSKNIF